MKLTLSVGHAVTSKSTKTKMNKIICFFTSHKSSNGHYLGNKRWKIECSRCGKILVYPSPHARLISLEMKFGFDGKG